jgi:hypothetical protein
MLNLKVKIGLSGMVKILNLIYFLVHIETNFDPIRGCRYHPCELCNTKYIGSEQMKLKTKEGRIVIYFFQL